MDGRDGKEAYETLKVMRQATYDGVGDWRIQLAEKLILPSLLDPTSQVFSSTGR
jgi:hypothetical protein